MKDSFEEEWMVRVGTRVENIIIVHGCIWEIKSNGSLSVTMEGFGLGSREELLNFNVL